MSDHLFRVIVVSALSGLIWGVIVLFILEPQARATLGAGVAFAPVIGITMGLVSMIFKDVDVLPLAAISLVSLYLAAALFGAGSALIFGIGRHSLHDVMSMTLLLPWAMTMGGYVFWMWPLTYLNHHLVAKFA